MLLIHVTHKLLIIYILCVGPAQRRTILFMAPRPAVRPADDSIGRAAIAFVCRCYTDSLAPARIPATGGAGRWNTCAPRRFSIQHGPVRRRRPRLERTRHANSQAYSGQRQRSDKLNRIIENWNEIGRFKSRIRIVDVLLNNYGAAGMIWKLGKKIKSSFKIAL